MTAVALHVEDRGGEGVPVVLAHAIGCDLRMWEPVAARLGHDMRLLLVDLRGHGRSPVPPRPYTLAAMADDVAAALDRLGIARAHWVGLSMGGMVGQAFALGHPARLDRLVLANTTSTYGPEGPATWRSRIRLVEDGGLEAIRDMVVARYFSAAFIAAHEDEVDRIMLRFLETSAQGYLGCCDAIAALDFSARLAAITAPTLAIAGELDAGTPVAMSQAIVDAIPGARLAVIEGAAHLSAAEKSAEFARLVEGFLAAAPNR